MKVYHGEGVACAKGVEHMGQCKGTFSATDPAGSYPYEPVDAPLIDETTKRLQVLNQALMDLAIRVERLERATR